MMSSSGIDPRILHGWLSARSLARGLPLPVADRGGFRVDTGSAAEIVRWVFPEMKEGLRDLARAIDEPRRLLKLCGTADELRAVLPAGWEIQAPGYFMQAVREPPARRLADGYRGELRRLGVVREMRIFSEAGELAANGYAAETEGVFVYDRIVTAPEHRRKGLGHAVMAMLHATREQAGCTELLVATEEGRALYATLGWETISPFSTAAIAAA